MSKIAPSRIARTMAAQLWPDVQSQYRCAPGVYGFSCAGHGGLVAVIGTAGLPADAVQAARDCGKIELAAVTLTTTGRGTSIKTSMKYTKESLRTWTEQRTDRELVECWIGEEDCDWATIAYVAPEVVAGGQRAGYFSQSADTEYVRGCLERWNPDFLARVDMVASGS
jgi:hypothetical protein